MFQVIRTDHFIDYTNTTGGSRLRVEQGSSSFFQGREFRINEEFNIPVGGEIVFKFVVGTNTILTFSELEVDQGGIRYSIWTQAQVAETTPFSTPVTIYRKNNTSTAPVIATQNQVLKGGTATFAGISNSVSRVRTSSGNASRSSTVSMTTQQRGFPTTTVYARLQSLDGINTASTGVLSLEWQEV